MLEDPLVLPASGIDFDTVAATFAFVDLVGYSALTEICGDQEAAQLAARLAELAHDALRPGVALVKTIGDAVMLVAGTPAQMVATICELADSVAVENGFLAVRAGIHHGNAVRHGDDFFGHAVNIAARIAALAGAGQAVITVEILDSTAEYGLPTRSLGPTLLRNITTSMTLHMVALTAAHRPRDLVCGIRIDPATAPARLQHEQRTWWFCSAACADRFAANPTRYTPPVSITTSEGPRAWHVTGHATD
ncbi:MULTISPECIES: adenylate/guanylate cyclase domain-containing protein [Mycobacteriaceae]|uniref:adenylate/guanylate cyclase domain-containing protein n=1 Tax=Mycobacteriaceae TaxID=1762 RepID=UPI00099398B7|nr:MULTISPECIES: adenylate/guanylate cyclase domain-containing protein [Mycobacteriaceae]MDM2175040.1 adenylate/guanylate cyclase domain-containing protein [Mycobacteroides abscessus]SKL51225.1 family 3 adenylate cyclase [Mycobacteroides abscessus subsp. bolletii]MDM2179739.1 adenylate/guanylate cyclase domain-containing protein [Mycobacteroides abscessus]MDM2207830.1 adenylate/guanylate cyclase domain-containing protein [Mycobacteroides abscessus]MDM2211424.1 adenylate/guanylate cyclase domai